MKRLAAVIMVSVLLLLTVAMALPALAAPATEWRIVTYSVAPKEEGGEPLTGKVGKEEQIPGNCTLQFSAEAAYVSIDGVEIAPGHAINEAGKYKITIVNRSDLNQKLEYDFYVMPDINLVSGQVFTSYPVITCTNAVKMEYSKDMAQHPLASGETLRGMGRYNIKVFGKVGEYLQDFNYEIYIKYCDSVHTVDPATGKEAIDVIVGDFGEDVVIKAVLDGDREMVKGSNIITDVGEHSLSVSVNGGETLDFLKNADSLPDGDDLALRIQLDIGAWESKDPYRFDFSRYDAQVLLDGQPVSGPIRVEKDGTHTLTVQGKDGKTVQNAFFVRAGEKEAYAPKTEVVFTFNNPHLIYVIFVAVPAALLLGVAVFFVVVRRRIV